MRNISSKTYIAIEVVLYIACNCGGKTVKTKDICDFQNVTLRYLENIMQALVKHKILKSVRGPKGGYILNKDRRRILLSDIFIAMGDIEKYSEKEESPIFDKITIPLSNDINNAIRSEFSKISIQDLYQKLQEEEDPLVSKNISEFVI